MSKEIRPIVEELNGEWTTEVGGLETEAKTSEAKLNLLRLKVNELIYWKGSI